MNSLEKSKTLVFGGAFDPPTVAHQNVIAHSLELPGFDKVWVMPCGNRNDKKLNADAYQRLAMLRLMKHEIFPKETRLEVVGFEALLGIPTTTYLTVEKLAESYPGMEFWYAFGADAYDGMDKWPGGQELKHELKMVIFSRDGHEVNQMENLIIVPIENFNGLSSSLTREAVATGKSIEHFVCSSVANYIKRHGLYGS